MATAFRRQPSARMVTGVRNLDRKLSKFKDSVNNRIIKTGLGAAAREGKKIAKAKITSRLKTVRAAVGSSGPKKNKPAKFGGGVGMKTKGKTVEKRAASFQKKRSSGGGVGISNNNVHWWLSGTRERQTKSGRSTGKMPANPVIKQSIASGKGQIMAAFRASVVNGIAKARKKLGLKGK